MSSPRTLVLLLPEQLAWADTVKAAGAEVVVDLTLGGGPVPADAWVRVVDTAHAPGTGPIIAASGPAVVGRECWAERTELGPLPDGYIGFFLRGSGSGGRAGIADVRALLHQAPAGVPVLVDWPHPPDEARPAQAGIVLSDVLFALLGPPPELRARLERISAAELRQVHGVNMVASVGAPAYRRVNRGEPIEQVAAGYWSADDPFHHAWPGGAGLLHAAGLSRRYGSLAAALAAYQGDAVTPTVTTATQTNQPTNPQATHDPSSPTIAVIGLGCRLPGALSVSTLWDQLCLGFSAIQDVPLSRWDPALFWDADPAVPDKTYTKIGAFVEGFTFQPRRFRVPPNVAPFIDPVQQMTLEAAADALEDGGYGQDRKFDRERVAVILGNSMGGEITHGYTLRVMVPAIRKALLDVPGFAALPDEDKARILVGYEESIRRDLPPITEDSMPGELSNVVAGRVANALDLGGTNFTTDAACAGSMAAMEAAIKGLQDGDFDMALTGGADRSMGVATYIKFCKIGALSADGSRPFDADANGFVMGEGVGILLLKRLDDALRDGDRIYALIRGMGASSDGRGKGITAPNIEGQKRALSRAYEHAGIDPADVDLFECHGTSTIVGDKVEVEALSAIIGAGRRRTPARIGSIKSNIGHLKSAAGAASTLKAVLALHHRVLPPSINYRRPRPDLPLDVVPLQVQTTTEASPDLRFAAVSAFGFGGTNFHMVLEGWRPGTLRPARRVRPPTSPAISAPAAPAAPVPAVVAAPLAPAAVTPVVTPAATPVVTPPRPTNSVTLPDGLWGVSADSPEEMLLRLRARLRGRVTPFEPDAPLRLCAAAENEAEQRAQIERAIAGIQKGKGYDLLRQRAIYIEDVPCNGQLALLFTGQGSQYIGMGLDLADAYPVVAQTFAEADAVMTPLLGRPLTDYIRQKPGVSEDEQFEALRATEISQPATLTVDVAILRLLASFGVQPDVVAGHSLGEYGAAVAAGMMSFQDALVAVSARGREMAAVQIDDFGKMASISTSVEVVMEVLAEVPGYVIPANKNCPSQTVIAGESEAVEAALELFRSRGITVFPLPVSHAFHSRIVAPAAEPLRRVLQGLSVQPPRRRISTNVTSRYYPTGPHAAEEAIDLLTRQVYSPVEWIDQIERMYADGARIFVECGPKRALTGFVVSILKHRPHRALYTNQPKRGGAMSFRDCLASLFALGFPVQATPSPVVDLFAEPGLRRSTTAALEARASRKVQEPSPPQPARGTPMVEKDILAIVSAKTGYPFEELDLDFDLEGDLGIDSVKLADIVSAVREHFKLEPDPGFKLGDYRTLRALIGYAATRVGAIQPAMSPPRPSAPVLPVDMADRFLQELARRDLVGLDAAGFAEAMLPSLQTFLKASWEAFQLARLPVPAGASTTPQPAQSAPPARPAAPAAARPAPAPAARPASTSPPASPPARRRRRYDGAVVCSGASVGLPGGEEVFAPDNFQRILAGENRIRRLPDAVSDRFLTKGLVRLVKNPTTGEGDFLPVERRDQVIRLAGYKAHFDLIADYGVDPTLVRSLDITTQLAFAAGLEALRDAGIPLVRTWRNTTAGKQVPLGWALPPEMRDTTGIVFASAFPGYDFLLQKLRTNGDDGEGRFDRRFLFQILSMGHSQFAQFIGARGPNTQVNAACASTTQALAVAEDWLRMGRCERVIIIAADDVTGDNLIEWIGSGFLAAGAATTEDKVENAALPFDRRRHGMILGMGAVGMVIETAEAVAARGMVPIAELLGTRISNSAFHGTRLDSEHIANEVRSFIADTLEFAETDAETFARRAVFLSHETYTPARGGSAAAEMAALPAAFGPAAAQIIVANTKGFTGHAMGAGIEDAVAVKLLQFQRVPPIPNLKEPDPDLGELTLATGGRVDVDYAVRLSAGFGSQMALAAWRRQATGEQRIANPAAHQAWLQRMGQGELVVKHRQLRYQTEPTELGEVTAPPRAPLPTAPAGISVDEVLHSLIDVVAARTGYDRAELDPSFELEADLGIDTVKQAEIFSAMREKYRLPRDDGFRLASYPTLRALAGYLAGRAGATVTPRAPAVVAAAAPVATPAVIAPAVATPAVVAPAVATPAVATPVAPPAATPAPPATPAAPPGIERGPDVLSTLMRVIASRSGYAESDLDPAFELEADLGIDTVKQAEIFSTMRSLYALPRDDSFRLADYPTIQKLAAYLERQHSGTIAPAAPAPVIEPAPAPEAPLPEPEATEEIILLTARPEPRTIPKKQEPQADAPVFSAEPSISIEDLEVPTPGFIVPPRRGPDDEDEDRPTVLDLFTPSSSAAAIERAPSPTASRPDVPYSTSLPASFRVRRPVRLSRPVQVHGFLTGRVVQVLGQSALADALRREAERRGARADGTPEIVIDAGMDVLELFRIARQLDPRPPAWWICVHDGGGNRQLTTAASNGARAGFAKALAREWGGCHARVIEFDSIFSAEETARLTIDELFSGDDATEVWLAPGQRDVAVLQTEALPRNPGWLEHPIVLLTGGTRGITARVARTIAQRGPCRLILVGRTPPAVSPLNEAEAREQIRDQLRQKGERITPRRIDDELRSLRAADEARETIEDLRRLGAQVEFLKVDMADAAAVRSLVEKVVARHGGIDLAIHGAGVEESRLLPDKDEEAFHRVYDGKAIGGLALAMHLPAATIFVSMGSIAGRFGNAGQVDYAAANQAMAAVCRTRPNALHICWTAWAEVGMAVRGGMEALLTSRGVELLPPEPGANLLCDLIAAGTTGELVVAGKLGDFHLPSFHPLLDSLELDGDTVIGHRRLTLHMDPWMADHTIDGVPVMPGVIGLELMVAVAAAARPQGTAQGVEQVRFHTPLKLYRDEPVHIEVRAEPEEGGVIRCMLRSRRVARTGRTLVSDHFEARVRMGPATKLPRLPSLFLPEDNIPQEEIYRRFFHGPTFQVLQQVEGFALQGLQVQANVDHGQIAEGLMTVPLVLEAAFQSAGLHTMILENIMVLPSVIEAMELVRTAMDGDPLTVTAHRRRDVYDVDVDDEQGCVMRIRGLKMIEKGPLPPDQRFAPPQGGWPSTGTAGAIEAQGALPKIEQVILSMRGTSHRQADRLAGQLAARRAVEGLVGSTPFSIERLPSGAPVVRGVDHIRVSLSHSGGEAVAVAVSDQEVGVDRERIAPRTPGFVDDWFQPGEVDATDPAAVTRAWAIKEAVLKALGTGMALSPRDVQVGADGVHLHGAAAARHAALGGGRLRVRTQVQGDQVIATVTF